MNKYAINSILVILLFITIGMGIAHSQSTNLSEIDFGQNDGFSFWRFPYLNETVGSGTLVLADVNPPRRRDLYWSLSTNSLERLNSSDASAYSLINTIPMDGTQDFWNGTSIKNVSLEISPRCGVYFGVSYSYVSGDQKNSSSFYIADRYQPTKKSTYCGHSLDVVIDTPSVGSAAILPDGRLVLFNYENNTAIAFMRPPIDRIINFDNVMYLIPQDLLKRQFSKINSADETARYQVVLDLIRKSRAIFVSVQTKYSYLSQNNETP